MYKVAARRRRDARRFVVLEPEIPDREDFESVVQARLDLATVLESVDCDQRDLIVSRYLLEESWKQVATRKRISDVAARLRCAKIMAQLRRRFGRDEPSP